MKSLLSKMKFLFVLLLGIVAALFPSGFVLAVGIATDSGAGKAIGGGETVSMEVIDRESPDLNRPDIDKEILKIRPNAYPIDQITRMAGKQKSVSMKCEYYTVDQKPTVTTLADAYTTPSASSSFSTGNAIINCALNDMFDPKDTILIRGVKGYESNGTTQSKKDLVLYVVSKSADGSGKLVVKAINGKKVANSSGKEFFCVPSIPAGKKMIRMAKAANELDVQADSYGIIPTKQDNYCQIFKLQVEEGKLAQMAAKEVEWKFSDIEESGVMDMRKGMEYSFIMGVKGITTDDKGKEVYLTEGVWHQAGKDFTYDPNAAFNEATLISMLKTAFAGTGSNNQKVFLAGSSLIEKISNVEYKRQVGAKDKEIVWGITFDKIVSKFGDVYVLYSEILDELGMEDYGLIIDPDYMKKKEFQSFEKKILDLQASGQRNVDASVLTEISCITLKYPETHCRISPQEA